MLETTSSQSALLQESLLEEASIIVWLIGTSLQYETATPQK